MAENQFTRKVGPLPVWAWGIVGGIAVYFLYTRYKGSSSTAAAQSPVATTLDPSAVDPTTGLTYGQELAGSYPTSGGLQAAADTTGAAGGTTSFDQGFQDFLGALGDLTQLTGALGLAPPNPSTSTVAAAGSAPLDNTAPVATNGNPGFTKKQLGQLKNILAPGKKATATKNPAAHKAKTIHVANPAPHQHQVSKPKTVAKPQPVKHPAGGGNPGKPASGSHAKPTTAPARQPAPVARHPAAPKPPPKPKPKARR